MAIENAECLRELPDPSKEFFRYLTLSFRYFEGFLGLDLAFDDRLASSLRL